MKPSLSLPLHIDQQAFPLYLMNFLVNLGVGILAPVLPELKAEFGISYGEAGLIVSAFGLSRLIFDLPVGWASERIKPLTILSLGTLLLTAGSIAAAFSPSYVGLVASRAVMGAGSAMCSTTALIILSHLSTSENRARTMSMFPVAASAGASFSPLIGGYLAALLDWRLSFAFCGLTSFASMLFVFMTQKHRVSLGEQDNGARPRQSRSSSPSGAGSTMLMTSTLVFPALIAANLSALTVYFSRQGLNLAIIPLYAGTALGMNAGELGTLLSVSTVIMIPNPAMHGMMGGDSRQFRVSDRISARFVRYGDGL